MNQLTLFTRAGIALAAVVCVTAACFTLSPSEVAADTPLLQPDAVSVTATTTHDFGMDDKPCVRTEFKTELVKKACAAGGQKAAKKAMAKFLGAAKKKQAEGEKKLNCKSCHTSIKDDYALTKDGLATFNKYK